MSQQIDEMLLATMPKAGAAHVMTNSEKELVDLIKKTNPGTAGDLSYENIVLSKAAVVDGREDTRNSQVMVAGIPEKGIAEKPKAVFYWRVDLGILFQKITASVGTNITEGMTTHDLVPALNEKYGTTITTDDIVQTPLDTTSLPGTCIIKAMDGNVKYTGEFSLSFDNSNLNLSDIIVNDSLLGFNYPSTNLTKGQASMYSYSLEAPADSETFWAAVEVDQPLPTQAEDHINALYGIPSTDLWHFDAANTVDFNLQGAVVKYTGNVEPESGLDATIESRFGIKPNPKFTKVTIIQLGDACKNFAGYFMVGRVPAAKK